MQEVGQLELSMVDLRRGFGCVGWGGACVAVKRKRRVTATELVGCVYGSLIRSAHSTPTQQFWICLHLAVLPGRTYMYAAVLSGQQRLGEIRVSVKGKNRRAT